MRVVKEVPVAGTFCTGTQSSCPAPEIDPYKTPLDPDGELAYMVRQRLDEGHSLKQIAWALDLHWMQVLGVAQSVASPPHVVHGDHQTSGASNPEAQHNRAQMEDDLNES